MQSHHEHGKGLVLSDEHLGAALAGAEVERVRTTTSTTEHVEARRAWQTDALLLQRLPHVAAFSSLISQD